MTRIAALQFKAKKDQPEESLRALCQRIEQAAQAGAQLVVCPEMATSGYLFSDASAIVDRCEPAHGGSFPTLSSLAKRHGLYLVCGYPEIAVTAADPAVDSAAPRLYNSARLIGPDGSLLYNYRKRLLYESDTTWASDGDTPYPIVDTPLGRLTVGICMDLNDDRFVDFLCRTSDSQALLVAFCTNWLDQGTDVLPYWCYRLRGFRGVFIAANTFGDESAPKHPPTRFCGRSTILSMDRVPPSSSLRKVRSPRPDRDGFDAAERVFDGRGDDSNDAGDEADEADWTENLRITVHARASRSGSAIVLADV